MRRLGLLGASGRMGKQVIAACQSPQYRARARIEVEFKRGMDYHTFANCEAVIDFSQPPATLEFVNYFSSVAAPPVLVIGTTGFSKSEFATLETYAARHPCLVASNFSTGVQALSKLLSNAVALPELDGYQVEIREIHHVHKKDAPSGTALTLRAQVPGEVEIESVREGEVVGTHEISFVSESDRIVLMHEAFDRKIFGLGAVETALRLIEKRASLPKKLLALRDVF